MSATDLQTSIANREIAFSKAKDLRNFVET